eukprot:4889460-Ditylum_brightwellii.AAC.1
MKQDLLQNLEAHTWLEEVIPLHTGVSDTELPIETPICLPVNSMYNHNLSQPKTGESTCGDEDEDWDVDWEEWMVNISREEDPTASEGI